MDGTFKLHQSTTGAMRSFSKQHGKHGFTQPAVTPTDTVVKAYYDLTQALQGKLNTRDTSQMEALTKLKGFFTPGH